MKYIVGTISTLLMTLALTACGETTNTEITSVEMGDNGTYINNADGTVTYISTTTNPNGEGITGDYDSSDDAETCTEKGFFYCTLSNTCINSDVSSGSCTR